MHRFPRNVPAVLAGSPVSPPERSRELARPWLVGFATAVLLLAVLAPQGSGAPPIALHGKIRVASQSRDAALLYALTDDGSVWRVDLATGQAGVIATSGGPVGLRAALSSLGHVAVPGNEPNGITLVRGREAVQHVTLGQFTRIDHVAFSADGRRLACAGRASRNLRSAVLSSATGDLLAEFIAPTPYVGVEAVALSGDGSVLAVNNTSVAYIVPLDDVDAAKALTNSGVVMYLELSHDGKLLGAHVAGEGYVVWNIERGRAVFSIALSTYYRSISFSDDRRLAALLLNARRVTIFDTTNWTTRRDFDMGPTTVVRRALLAADGSEIRIAEHFGGIRVLPVDDARK